MTIILGWWKKLVERATSVRLGILFLISTQALLHVPFMLILLLPYAASILKYLIPTSRYSRLVSFILLGLLLLGSGWLSYQKWMYYRAFHSSRYITYPKQAVAALYALKPIGRMFNEYDWGGYLDYMYPEKQVFIDGRMPTWQVNNRYIIDDYETLADLGPDFAKTFAKYNPDWFIIRRSLPLAKWLQLNPSYRLMYADTLAVIYLKNP